MVQQSKFAQVFDAKLEKVDSAMSAINGIVWAEAQLGMRLKRARNQRDLVSPKVSVHMLMDPSS